MMHYQDRLDAAVAAAQKAGEYLLSQPSFTVSHKQSNDYVTDCDRGSEQLIREMLLSAFPEDGFLGEENGEQAGKAGRWIVDPIDGTTNFICDLPLYTISIAYEEAGEIVVGCVYCPRLDEMYTAVKGGGAFLNGKPIHVSSETVLRDAIVAMAFAHRNDEKGARIIRLLPRMRRNFSDMRRLGSAALDLCFTACGRFEAYVELDLNLYDIAAGVLIVQEAGGKVTGWPGDSDSPLKTGNVIASCPQLWEGVYETLSE